MKHDRRKEKRNSSSLAAGVYLSEGTGGPPVSSVFYGRLTSISKRGAGVALHEIMADRTHLAFGPMESEILLFNIQLQLNDHEPIIIAAKPIWFNKVSHKTIPPFRIGLEFLQPLTLKELNRINRHFR